MTKQFDAILTTVKDEYERQEIIIAEDNDIMTRQAKVITELEKQIEKFKTIAVHIQEQCCDDCEDTSMCEYECAITELKLSLSSPVPNKKVKQE